MEQPQEDQSTSTAYCTRPVSWFASNIPVKFAVMGWAQATVPACKIPGLLQRLGAGTTARKITIKSVLTYALVGLKCSHSIRDRESGNASAPQSMCCARIGFKRCALGVPMIATSGQQQPRKHKYIIRCYAIHFLGQEFVYIITSTCMAFLCCLEMRWCCRALALFLQFS